MNTTEITILYKLSSFNIHIVMYIFIITFDATAQLIHALITSRLDFCNSIRYNLPNNQIEILQRIHNQAVRLLKRIP